MRIARRTQLSMAQVLLVAGIAVSMLCGFSVPGQAGSLRPVALGGAFVAAAAAPAGALWNPAGIALISRRELGGQFSSGLSGAPLRGLLYYAEPDGGYGAGVLSWRGDSVLTGYDQNTGRMLYRKMSRMDYSIARSIDGFGAAGLDLHYERYVEERSGTQVEGTTYRFDVGYRGQISDRLSAGIVGKNLLGSDLRWSDGSVDRPQARWDVGLMLYPNDSFQVTADVHDILEQQGSRTLAVGVEAKLPVTLRGGLRWQGGSFSQTLGLAYQDGPIEVEYAWDNAGGTGTHSVGMAYRF